MRASRARIWPCRCLISPDVLRAASHAVATMEHTAISTELATSRTSRLWRMVADQLVPDAVHRAQPDRPPRLRLDLLAQVLHVHVDGTLGDEAVEAVQVL